MNQSQYSEMQRTIEELKNKNKTDNEKLSWELQE